MRKALAYGAIHHRSRRCWLRVIAAVLIPVQVLTLQPAVLWAATKDTTAPGIPEVIVPAVPSSPPPVAGPRPDLLAREEARLEKAKAALPFKFKPQADHGEPRELPETPSDIQITHCGIFKSPILSTGKSTPKENAALGAVLQLFQNRDNREDLSILEEWIKDNPASVWRTSVQLHVGEMYLAFGYFNRAVAHLKPVYSLAKQAKGQTGEYLLGQSAVLYSKALARSGNSKSANEVLQDMDGKPQSGPVLEELRRMRSTVPKNDSIRLVGTCGLDAVTQLRRATFPNTELPLVLRDTKEQNRLNLIPTSNAGMNLTQLESMAKAAAVPLIPGKKEKNANWVAPSIIHWKSQHFSLLLKKSGSSYLVRDPYLGGDQWFSETALAEETTGYAMLGVPNLPKGWSAPSKGEMNAISGRQAPSPTAAPKPEDEKKCDAQSGDCNSCNGMPDYTLYLAQASLGMNDTPISYQSAFGTIDFTATYHQRNVIQPISLESDFLGPNWTFNWLSWVDDEVDMPFCPLGDFSLERTGEEATLKGKATVFELGGGTTQYTVVPRQFSWIVSFAEDGNGGHYISSWNGQCPKNSHVLFQPDSRSRSSLNRIAGPSSLYDEVSGSNANWECCQPVNPPAALQYERKTVDGTVYHYGFDGTYGFSFSSRAYLAYIQYPSGRKLGIKYWDDLPMKILRIEEVTSAGTDIVMQFDYALSGAKWLLETVTDKAGRTAHFNYNANGQLFRITDAEGMSSTFEYENGAFITKLKTPYGGETMFAEGSSDSKRWIQASRIIDGEVARTERVELQFDSTGQPQFDSLGTPAGMNVRNASLDRRNSYYWNFRAMAEMGNPGPEEIDYSVAYGLARQTHWLWDPGENRLVGIPSSKKNPLESRVWYEYGTTNGAPDQFWEPEPRPTAVGRILDGNVSQVNRYEYNPAGLIKKRIDPWDPDRNPATGGRTTEYEYSPDGELLTKIKQKTGASTYDILAEYTYNPTPGVGNNPSDDRLAATLKDAAGQTTTRTYDNFGRIATITRTRNGLQETRAYVYYDGTQGVNAYRLWKIVAANSAVACEYTYSATGQVLTHKDEDGFVVTHFYDNLDRPTRTDYPDGTYNQLIYNKLELEWYRDCQGRWTHSEYDAFGKATSVTDPIGRKTQFDWCACGALDGITDPANQTTAFVRDLQARLTAKVYPDGTTTKFHYQPLSGRMDWMLDARNQRLNFEYYEDGNVKRKFYTDQNGDPLPFVRADVNAEASWEYDNTYNRMVKMIDVHGETTFGYVLYAPANATYGDGKLQTVDGPLANDTISFVFDEYGRVKQLDINGSTTSKIFDTLGRISSETNPLGTFTYGFDGQSNRVSQTSNGMGFVTQYSYFGNVAPSGTGDGDRRLSGIKNYSSSTSLDIQYDYHYTPNGNISQWSLKWGAGMTNGHDYLLSYDAADQLVGAEDRFPGTSNIQKRFGYSYDDAGNRTTEQIGTPAGGGTDSIAITQASYNNTNQLTSRSGGSGMLEVQGTVNELSEVKVNGAPTTSLRKQSANTYEFKGGANVTSGSNTVTVAAKDARGNESTLSKTVSISGSAIPSLTYDAAGNLISDGANSYAWDAESRLVSITRDSGTSVTEFSYDGLGRRNRIVEKTLGVVQSERRLLWNGLDIAEERDAANVTTQRFFRQGEQEGATVQLYRRDHLGSVRETTDATGIVTSRYDYDLWGRRTKLSGTANADFGYTGHYYHSPSGLHLAPYRAYSAELGRWLSRDPIGESGGLNLYGYVLNRVVGATDPLGFAMKEAVDCEKLKQELDQALKDQDALEDQVDGLNEDVKNAQLYFNCCVAAVLIAQAAVWVAILTSATPVGWAVFLAAEAGVVGALYFMKQAQDALETVAKRRNEARDKLKKLNERIKELRRKHEKCCHDPVSPENGGKPLGPNVA